MVIFTKGVLDRYSYANPNHDRPRSPDLFGVTEILYCMRKAFLQRVVPAPTAIDFVTRTRFARGHACESAFFGEDKHNPEYFVGDKELKGSEGHSDHVVRYEAGDIKEIVEFKSVRRLWYKAPNGKAYYSIGMARKAIDKEDWGKIEHRYNDSHMDQLKTYMYITDAPMGVLIYYELSTDDHYTYEITSDEISEEFKIRTKDRLKILKEAMRDLKVPDKSFSYDWECKLCSFNKNGLCALCDVDGFDLRKLCSKLTNGKIEDTFGKVVGEALEKYNVKAGMEGSN